MIMDEVILLRDTPCVEKNRPTSKIVAQTSNKSAAQTCNQSVARTCNQSAAQTSNKSAAQTCNYFFIKHSFLSTILIQLTKRGY